MKTLRIIFALIFLLNISCTNNPEKLASTVQSDNKTQFDIAKATVIIEKRSREFEEALIVGDSIAVGDIYTIDTKIIPYLSGRNEVIGAAGSMIRNNQTLRLTIKTYGAIIILLSKMPT